MNNYKEVKCGALQMRKGWRRIWKINEDFEKFVSWKDKKTDIALCCEFKTLIISLTNFLYKIDIDDKDKKLLYRTFKDNKKMLRALNIKKKDFKIDILDAVEEALAYSYK